MGGVASAVKGFVVDVGKFVLKKGVSFLGGKIPIVGGWIADKINNQIGGRFAKGGMIGYAKGGDVGAKYLQIMNAAQLMKLVRTFPELAKKHGITEDKLTVWQQKYSPDENATQVKTALEQDQGEKKADEYAANPDVNKSLALKKGGKVMMATGGMAKCAKGGAMSVGVKKTNPWLEHVKAFRATAKGKAMSYSDALKSAKLTYKKM
jgi:hypothetical protein